MIEQRVFLKKEQLKSQQFMLMLTSSSSSSKKQTFLNQKADHFQAKFQNFPHHWIQSSFNQNIILSKQYVVNALIKYFSKPILNFYFFYSGPVDSDPIYKGNIVLQSIQGRQARQKQPQNYSISLESIVRIWNQNKLCKESHLYIFVDSSSGQWCERLSNMKEQAESVSVIAACNQEEAVRLKGGFLFNSIFIKDQDFEKSLSNFEHLYPKFVSRSKKCSQFSKKHLQLLQEDIRNVTRFSSQWEEIKLKDFPKMDQKVQILHSEVEKYLDQIKMLQKQLEQVKMPKISKAEQPKSFFEKIGLLSPQTASRFVDPQCRDLNLLVVSGTTITAKDYAYIFGKSRLLGRSQFTVTFTKIGDVVWLGAVDTQNKSKLCYQWNPNRAEYSTSSYCFFGGNDQFNQGSGFKAGEPITVVVDLIKGSIQWKVGSQVRHQVQYQKLKDSSICWVPYIQLPNKDDSVIISE